VTIEDLYELCEREADTARDDGHASVGPGHGRDQVWRRRVRNAVQHLRRHGRARPVAVGTWLINAPGERATVYLLLDSNTALRDVALRVQNACELLTSLDEAADLILTDPPCSSPARCPDGRFRLR